MALLAMRSIRKITSIDLRELLVLTREFPEQETGANYFMIVLRYLFSVGSNLTEEDFYKLVETSETIYPEGSEKIMTLAEIFMEKGEKVGIEKGIEKGEKVGREKEKKEVTQRLIAKGFSLDEAVELVGLSVKEYKEIYQKD